MTLLLDQDQPQSLLTLLPSPPKTLPLELPSMISANDIRELLQYLKRKSGGVVVAEEIDRSRRRLFEEKKLDAYHNLGITAENGHLLTLSALGWKLASRLEPGTLGFRHLLNRTPAYLAALNWMHDKNLEVVTSTDLLAFWCASNDEGNTRVDEDLIKAAAISFFSLCQAAELGIVTLGKRGHITRLYVDHEELSSFVESNSVRCLCTNAESLEDPGEFTSSTQIPASHTWSTPASLRVLIIKSENDLLVDLIQRTLEVARVDSLTIERDWNTRSALDFDLYQYANQYDVLFVILDEDSFWEDHTGTCRVKQKILIDIGVALALFKLRVVLFGNKKIEVPEAGYNILYYPFEKDTLPWEVGLEVISTIESFKSEMCQSAR